MSRPMDNGILVKNPERIMDGWISPTGNFWAVEECSHYSFAAERTGTIMDPCNVLENRGWIHLSNGSMYVGRMFDCSAGQMDTLMLLAADRQSVVFRRFAASWLDIMGVPLPE